MMGRMVMVSVLAALGVATFGQGGAAGGLAQGGQGGQQAEYDRSVRGIDAAIGVYLNAEEIKNILTPGEYSEWTLDLKAGQVVVAEARSDAFDPALEVTDERKTVLATNDDRYPGDQRPLLIWRCPADGKYALRARCFQNKAGGQFFIRFNTYNSMDLYDKLTDKDATRGELIFLRVPMKAGQVKRIMTSVPRGFMGATVRSKIGPTGLPNPDLVGPMAEIAADRSTWTRGNNLLMAPVDGDYYVMVDAWGPEKGKLRAVADNLMPGKVESTSSSQKAPTGIPAMWEISVKKGEFISIATPELHTDSNLNVIEAPDISKFDMKKDDANPFFPRLKKKGDEDKGEAFTPMWARARDPRMVLLIANRDAKLWIGTDAVGQEKSQYTLSVKPAARDLEAGKPLQTTLRVANTDYWAFDAKVGDVMTFKSGAADFSQRIAVRDPDLNEIWTSEAGVDQSSTDWSLIARKPGRYLVAVSCLGDGGGGQYSISRNVFEAKAFGKGSPASGEIGNGDVHIWKFKADPKDPLYVHWRATNPQYTVSVLEDTGEAAGLGLTRIDESNEFGILKVDKPKTYLIVLIGTGAKSRYSIDLSTLPGIGKL